MSEIGECHMEISFLRNLADSGALTLEQGVMLRQCANVLSAHEKLLAVNAAQEPNND